MRQSFCGYYAPDDTEIKQMLSEGIWVFDTNVLLDLFRLSENNANRVLEVFEKEKEHLWLPYQIAKEYHENLVTVIKKQHEECRKMIKALSDFSDKFQIRRNQSFLDETMKCEAERFSVQMKNALEQKQLSLKDLIHNNPVKSRISDIFEKRVGGKPTPENELEYKAIAKGRYSQKVPQAMRMHLNLTIKNMEIISCGVRLWIMLEKIKKTSFLSREIQKKIGLRRNLEKRLVLGPN